MVSLVRVAGAVALACALALHTASSAKVALDPLADESHAIAKVVAQSLREAEGGARALLGEAPVQPRHHAAEDNRVLQRTSAQSTTRAKAKSKKAKAKQAKKAKAKAAKTKAAKANAAKAQEVDVMAVTDGADKQSNCAWQAYVTGNNINAAYPDTHCVYQVLVMLGTTQDKIFRIKGKFPTTGNRYFSLQSNNPDIGFPLATIRDFEIQPDPDSGKNPYAEEASPDEVGTYTIYVTPYGEQGYINEIPLCTKDTPAAKCRSINAVMIMRFYTSDPDLGVLNSETDQPGGHEPRLFGYVPAPKVEIRTRKATSLRPETWEEFKPCDQSRPTPITRQIEDNFAKVIPGWGTPRYGDVNENFILYLGQDSSTNGVYPNLDATYLVANTWQNALADTSNGERLIAKVTGVLPLTAASFTRDPKIPNWQEYEIRFNSFSTINKIQTAPTLQSIDDSAFRRFYGDRPGWNEHRAYSIVVAPNPDMACGLYNPQEDLFLTTTSADGTIADHFAILDRQLIPRFTRDGKPDRSITYARTKCGSMSDNVACFKPAVLREILGDYYPSITWYTCDKDNNLRPAFTQTLMEKYFP